MFTLEDMDLADDLAYIRENGSRFLPHDLRQDCDATTHPDADATRHPYDYLIVR